MQQLKLWYQALDHKTLKYAVGLLGLAVYHALVTGNNAAAFATAMGVVGTLVLGPAYTVSFAKTASQSLPSDLSPPSPPL